VKAVAIIGSETGSVYFDPQQASEEHGQLVNLMMMGDGRRRDHCGEKRVTRRTFDL